MAQLAPINQPAAPLSTRRQDPADFVSTPWDVRVALYAAVLAAELDEGEMLDLLLHDLLH